MKKKLKTAFAVLFFLLACLICKPQIIQAVGNPSNNIYVTFEKTPLFSQTSDGLWMPGYSLTRSAYVRNDNAVPRIIRLSTENFVGSTPDLKDVLEIAVVDNHGNTLYGGSLGTQFLSDFYTLSEYPLTVLLPGSDVTYFFTVSLDSSIGNLWQNKHTGFDLILGFDSEEYPLVTPTPTPTETSAPTPTSQENPGPTSTPVSGTTNTPIPVPTATTPTPISDGEVLNGYFVPVLYEGNVVEVPVLGAKTSKATSTPTLIPKLARGQVEGKGICVNPWWWFWLYLIQAIIQFFLTRAKKRTRTVFILLAQAFVGAVTAWIFWKYFCWIIFMIISILISVVFFLLTSIGKTTSNR